MKAPSLPFSGMCGCKAQRAGPLAFAERSRLYLGAAIDEQQKQRRVAIRVLPPRAPLRMEALIERPRRHQLKALRLQRLSWTSASVPHSICNCRLSVALRCWFYRQRRPSVFMPKSYVTICMCDEQEAARISLQTCEHTFHACAAHDNKEGRCCK